MDLPVSYLLTVMALRAEETLQILTPLASLTASAVLLSPRIRSRLGWMGTASSLVVALLVGVIAIYALERV